jgi:hypothetical protein
MNKTIQDLKVVLFSIMEDAFLPSDINATQQMGIQLSNAVKREGVLIIQNQNVEVYARIIPRVVKAIRLCDDISLANHYEKPMVEIEKKEPPEDPVEECCSFLFDQNTKWEAMQKMMRYRYLEYVTSKFKTKIEAANMLGIGPTYLSKLSQGDE